ncbi:MAG: hypothetical protein SGPRY_010565, partial [Prymnesium sp.]
RFTAAVLAYRYIPPSLSLLERLYLEAFWDLLAARVYPSWLAPNVITLLGVMCDVAAFSLAAYHSVALRGEAPSWVYATNGLLLLAYQSFDGSDGKQARRTRSGSALGEFMDHGLDALVIGLICAFTVDAMGFGWCSVELWGTVFGAQVSSVCVPTTTPSHCTMTRCTALGDDS